MIGGDERTTVLHGLIGLIIALTDFALVFTALHSIANARQLGRVILPPRYAELHSFAAKILQTVENNREKFVLMFSSYACA